MAITENLISNAQNTKHNIQKYQFRVINSLEDDMLVASSAPTEHHPKPKAEPQHIEPQVQFIPQVQPPAIDKEIVDRLLSKTEELASTVFKMQAQIEGQQSEIDKRLERERQRAYQEGYEKGKEDMFAELNASVDEAKTALLDSVNTISEASKSFDSSLSSIEKELSSIAVDIAGEVIVTEVKERGQEVALELAKVLIENLKEATSITIKLHPSDYGFVKDSLETDKRIKLESNKAIAKGGVVIISDVGNIDGNIMTRYQTLKNSLLEAKNEEKQGT